MDDLIARLRDYCIDWSGEPIVDGSTPRIEISCGEIREAAEALSRQPAEIAELREALKPFAECAATYADEQPDSRRVIEREPCIRVINLGDLRRARAALTKKDTPDAG